MEVKPYKNLPGSKKEQVARMFDGISHRYDLLNRVLSLGIDRIWRKKQLICSGRCSPGMFWT